MLLADSFTMCQTAFTVTPSPHAFLYRHAISPCLSYFADPAEQLLLKVI